MKDILHRFCDDEAAGITLPKNFTNPFHYLPHPLAVRAMQRVMSHLDSRTEWQEELKRGKMFGVLVVKGCFPDTYGTPIMPDTVSCDATSEASSLGFLVAFSGNLAGSNVHDGFVPPVYDMLRPGDFFRVGEEEINRINRQIAEIEQADDYRALHRELEEIRQKAEAEIESHRALMAASKSRRDEARRSGNADTEALLNESRWMKAELKRIKERNRIAIADAERVVQLIDSYVDGLREERRQRSAQLQRRIFDRFVMLNARGERRTLTEIFADTPQQLPPGGAGECAAPKLLQYAFTRHLTPVAMAEFWYGESPQGEIRHHGHFYPACRNKCLPILTFMLQGLKVDAEPTYEPDEPLRVLYEDEYMIAVDKPAGIITVPGKLDATSLQQMVEAAIGGEAHVVHRLDMATSGVVVFAKDSATHRALQRQFASRSTRKVYIALLDGVPASESGSISLPLRPDIDHRPQQMVDFEHGKPAHTTYRVVNDTGESILCRSSDDVDTPHHSITRVELYPSTGRTHQLRVHCAHPLGLNAAILGDTLYHNSASAKAPRMYLHAETLEITHPESGERLKIISPAPF